MSTNSSSLAVDSREAQSSREARRARRAGRVPGVIYGGSDAPQPIVADARELRNAIAGSGAVIDVVIDGGASQPVVVKDAHRHPVRGEILHVDLLRVDLKQKIQQPVPLELTDVEESAGNKKGGVVEHVLREVTVEALPTDIPESVSVSVLELEIGDTLTLADVRVPSGVTIVDDAEQLVVSVSAPRLVVESAADEAAEGDAPAEAADGESGDEDGAGE